ncbi:putative glutathione S-transferase [Rosellinia necatrix]|uniref:Putative glutathione S-transferase n=1 Tax=Rosellinia necatrix TaxID=77044 RepID=A0A1W2TS84_ROSNE|nr:putative glutathione S-transferase [Rosellinia necatrix]
MASVVDTSLPAKPTGAAAAFAASHAAEHDLKLYGGWFCPFVQRAWVVLHEKRIAHQYVEINPYHKSAEFLALNPRGLVPTLAVPRATAGRGDGDGDGDGDGGGIGGEKPLYESTIICEYLDEAYGDESAHGPALLPRGDAPADVYLRARCRLWIDHIGGKVVPAFYKMLQHTPDKAHSMAEARREFLAHARTLVREMGAGGPWFLGARFSLVDVMLAPWAKRLFLIDHYKPGGVGIPTAGEEEEEDAEVWDRWRLWFDAITQRQSVKDTWSDDEMYIRSYKRYAEDTTESEVGRATRKGERLP